jgi:hypothetical protein
MNVQQVTPASKANHHAHSVTLMREVLQELVVAQPVLQDAKLAPPILASVLLAMLDTN